MQIIMGESRAVIPLVSAQESEEDHDHHEPSAYQQHVCNDGES